jgi:ABC-type glycerol-3-phosphate transport system permease component
VSHRAPAIDLPSRATIRSPRAAWRRWASRGALYAFLIAGALVVCLPYVWMISAAFKTPGEIFQTNLIPREPHLDNFRQLFRNYPIDLWLINSFIVSIVVLVSNLVWATSAGYAFARLRFPGRDTIFLIYIGAMMVPIQVRLIPSFILLRELGMLNTLQGIASIQLVEFFCIFLMRQFMLSLPYELEEAARIDGCSYLRLLVQIIVPNVKPALIALGLLSFTASWNNFLWPLVVINNPNVMTIQVGLSSMKGENLNWGVLMAGTAISAIPLAVLYVGLQRLFTQGVVLSGIKG